MKGYSFVKKIEFCYLDKKCDFEGKPEPMRDQPELVCHTNECDFETVHREPTCQVDMKRKERREKKNRLCCAGMLTALSGANVDAVGFPQTPLPCHRSRNAAALQLRLLSDAHHHSFPGGCCC